MTDLSTVEYEALGAVARITLNRPEVLNAFNEALASDLSLMPKRFAWDAPPPVLPDEEGRYAVPVPGVTRAY